MSVQLSVTVRNARLDALETAVGTSPKLYLYTGSVPANCAASDPAGQLCALTLPSDWMAAAASGVKALLGTWTGVATAAGSAASFRIKDSTGTTTHIQGTVTATGGGGDLTLDSVALVISPLATNIAITSFSLTEGNA